MARYFAKIGIGNIVDDVYHITGFEDATDQGCKDYLSNTYGEATWEECYKTTVDNPKKNYPSAGFYWHPDNNLFAGQQNYPSWTLNTTNGTWEAPTPRPSLSFTVAEGSTVDDNTPEQNAEIEENAKYYWDEASLSWVLPTE
jgi:hypothetical protein